MGAAAVLAVARFRSDPQFVLAGAAVSLLLGGITVARPAVWSKPYRAWNAAARYLRAAVLLYLLAICYFVVFPLAGRAGSRLILGRNGIGGTMWSSRATLEHGAYLTEDHYVPSPSAHDIEGYLGWLRRSGAWWALGIFAFAKLADAHSSSHGRPPANIYTLY